MDPGHHSGLTVRDVLREMADLGARGRAAILIVIVGLTVIGTIVDVIEVNSSDFGGGGTLLLSVATVAAEYYLFLFLMRASEMMEAPQTRGFGTYFLQLVVKQLAIICGLLLLIVPGLILLIRWLPSYAYIFGQGMSAIPAMSRSWAVTRPCFWPAAVAALIPVLGYSLGLLVYLAPGYIPELLQEQLFIVVSLIANVLLSAASAAWILLGLAVYSLIENAARRASAVSDVFT